MKVAAILSTACVCLVGLLLGSTLPAPAVEGYQIDPIHSSMVFRIKHMGAANFYGRFNNITGSFILDDDPSKCSFQIQIRTDSVDTAQKKRDDHLRSPDFFNATQFPTISFKSTQVKKSGDSEFEVTGDLALHGVTKPVTAKVTKTGSGDMRGRQIVGIEAQLTIKRSEFGMTYGGNMLGEDVYIIVSLEGGKQ